MPCRKAMCPVAPPPPTYVPLPLLHCQRAAVSVIVMIVHQQTLRTSHSPPSTCAQRCALLWCHALTHKNQTPVHTVLPPNILHPPTTLPLYLPLIHEIFHARSILFNSTKMQDASVKLLRPTTVRSILTSCTD